VEEEERKRGEEEEEEEAHLTVFIKGVETSLCSIFSSVQADSTITSLIINFQFN
jgi:hypothetical protein